MAEALQIIHQRRKRVAEMRGKDAVGVGGGGGDAVRAWLKGDLCLLHLMPLPSTGTASAFWGLVHSYNLANDFFFASAGILGLSRCIKVSGGARAISQPAPIDG